jgi:O-methyltransferase
MILLRRLLNSDLMLRALNIVDKRSENRITEFGMLAQAFQFAKINGISGDYLEFGVWKGKTFTYAKKMSRRYDVKTHFYAFDSFEGLPETTETKYQIWSPGSFTCSMEEFESILMSNGFKTTEYSLIKGFYNNSLTPELRQSLLKRGLRASIVYIDCDLYESTRDVLEFLAPFLQDGTILCFDDYYNYRGRPDMGEQRALKEFQSQNRSVRLQPYLPYSPLGMSFLCHLVENPDAVARGYG